MVPLVPNSPHFPQWFQIVSNGRKWSQMVLNYPKLSQMVSNGRKWSQMVINYPKLSQMVQIGPKWSQKCYQMTSDGFKLSQNVPNSSKWSKWTLWYALHSCQFFTTFFGGGVLICPSYLTLPAIGKRVTPMSAMLMLRNIVLLLRLGRWWYSNPMIKKRVITMVAV